MDIERDKRQQIMDSLGERFFCIEECEIEHAIFNGVIVRADLIPISKEVPELGAFAFEAKVPTPSRELKNRIEAIRQASDYCYGRILDQGLEASFKKMRVECAFISPAPNLQQWSESDSQLNRFYRKHDLEPIRGTILFAQHLKVGTAVIEHINPQHSRLRLGTDTVWSNRFGYTDKARTLRTRTRIGSRSMDIFSMFSANTNSSLMSALHGTNHAIRPTPRISTAGRATGRHRAPPVRARNAPFSRFQDGTHPRPTGLHPSDLRPGPHLVRVPVARGAGWRPERKRRA